jgi:hypothetical protein
MRRYLWLVAVLLSACGCEAVRIDPLPPVPIPSPTPTPSPVPPQPAPVPIDDSTAAPWSALDGVKAGSDLASLAPLGRPWQTYATPGGDEVRSFRVRTLDGKVHNAHVTLSGGKVAYLEVR